jgi:hypothetical protein
MGGGSSKEDEVKETKDKDGKDGEKHVRFLRALFLSRSFARRCRRKERRWSTSSRSLRTSGMAP